MELDFDKYCVVGGSPTTVLPAPRCHSRVSNRKSSGKPKCGNYTLGLVGDFSETDFNRYRSASCRDARSRRSTQEVNEMRKRGSVYQSSKEVMQLKKTDVVGRKKIEFSRGSVSALPFGIIDSLCSSDDDSLLVERNQSSVVSFSGQTTGYFPESQIGLRSRDSINHSIPRRSARQNVTSLDRRDRRFTDHHHIQDMSLTSESVGVPINGTKNSRERVPAVNLRKSLSEKLALPHSPAQSDSDGSKTSSPKTFLNPARVSFNPFVKSKSRRSPLNCLDETGSKIDGHVGISCNETMSKPPLNASSNKLHQKEHSSLCVKKENNNSTALPCPARLHGILKVENKNGVPFFEFSVKSPEDVYVAKTWKEDNALTWAYTFHSLHPRRKSNANGWGTKDHNKESTMVGQMLVSCYLCKELKGDRGYYDSMATEFVLYDITHLQSDSNRDKFSCSPDASKVPSVLDEPLSSRLMAAAELNPELEVAAIILQVPYEKRASLKFESQVEHADKEVSDSTNPAKMHVVIPSGNHSLPSSKSCGPSPLLDRWRLGGGCDCGGWDMSCPLYVFGNPYFDTAQGFPPVEYQHPTELFVQGKNDTPAYSMTAIRDGEYAVDFHAQLSSLQAFSICVAILDSAETSTAAGHKRIQQTLQSDSLRVFADEEIKVLINFKGEAFQGNDEVEETFPSFTLNPPFSPISRV